MIVFYIKIFYKFGLSMKNKIIELFDNNYY